MKKLIVSEIIRMIETHLDGGVSVEDVVAFSGYSRRRLQDIFKLETGCSIGGYIRARRLYKAAIRLRLCSQSLTVIAHELGFDSQQSFSREFKKRFGCTPRDYRQMNSWDLTSLQPVVTLGLGTVVLPELDICLLPDLYINGCEFQQEIDVSVCGTASADNSIRKNFIVDRLNRTSADIYLMSSFSAHEKKENTILTRTFIGTVIGIMKSEGEENRKFHGGKFAHLQFIGGWDEYSEFPSKVYMNMLSQHSLKRRDGFDIEVIRCGGENFCHIICDYYIPIEEVKELIPQKDLQ